MPSEKMTLESLRDELPITGKVAYLNTGSHGPPPDSVLASVADEMALQAHNYGLPSVSAPQGAREKAAREGLARFIGAKPEEVAMTPNTTQAMRQVSQSIGWSEGDEFMVTSLEHVSTVSLGSALQQDVGVKMTVVEADQGDAEFLETLKSSLSESTRLLCISHVASPDGRILPVAEAAELAHERGVPVVVDVAQSLGQFPVDVPALGCDFMIGSGHKWLLGPMGVGILWVASDQLPSFKPNPVPEREPWSPLDSPIEAPTAARMAEKGTHNTAMVIGTGRAVEIIDEIGTDTIAAHTGKLSRGAPGSGSRHGRRQHSHPHGAGPLRRHHDPDIRRVHSGRSAGAGRPDLRETQHDGEVPMAHRPDERRQYRDAYLSLGLQHRG